MPRGKEEINPEPNWNLKRWHFKMIVLTQMKKIEALEKNLCLQLIGKKVLKSKKRVIFSKFQTQRAV